MVTFRSATVRLPRWSTTFSAAAAATGAATEAAAAAAGTAAPCGRPAARCRRRHDGAQLQDDAEEDEEHGGVPGHSCHHD